MSALQSLHALNLDPNQQEKFIEFYNNLPEKPASTVRLFSHNDYYTTYAQDAITSAKSVFSSTANIKTMGRNTIKLDYLVLSKNNFEALIKKLLLVMRYRVEIYQNEGSMKNFQWVVKYKGTPGNLTQFEDIFEVDFTDSNAITNKSLMAVNVKIDSSTKNRVVGVACLSVSDYNMSVVEFTDDDLMTELETVTVQLSPSECIIPQNVPDIEIIQRIMTRAGISLTTCNRSHYGTDGLVQDLNRLLKFGSKQKQDAHSLPETKLEIAMSSLAAAIKYLELTSDETNFERYHLKTVKANNFVHIDSAALSALNVFPEADATMSKGVTSLYNLLDHCRTTHGKRLLAQWLRQPLRDINLINERLDIVDAFINTSEVRIQLHEDHLRRIPDIQTLTRRLSRKKAHLKDCYKLYQVVIRLPNLIKCLALIDCPSLDAAISSQISELCTDLGKFKEMIEATIDFSAVERGEILIKPEFDEQLQNYRQKMEKLQSAAEKHLRKVTDQLCLENGKVKLESNALGFVFRVTLKDEKNIRNNKNYKIVDAIKGGVRFQSRDLESISQDYIQAKSYYETEQQKVVDEILDISKGYIDVLFCLSHILAKLDVLVSYSIACVQAPVQYNRAVMVESLDEFVLKDVRHPCIEMIDNVSYVPNDVVFKRGEGIMHIVTGPNMGGKSTWMRSCGIAALMSHAGCPIAASEAKIPILSAILARVGAQDSEITGQSTFMMEMIEASAIMKGAKNDSLVLIDELGRGTSTYEGCGLAWAIAENLAKESECFCLFATHYHELTHLSSVMPNVIINSHVKAEVINGDLVLLHKIDKGPATKSLGLHIAKLANIPKDVLEEAEEMQKHLEVNNENESLMNHQDIEEAHKITCEFINKIKSALSEGVDDEVIVGKVDKLKDEIRKCDNLFLNSLISA